MISKKSAVSATRHGLDARKSNMPRKISKSLCLCILMWRGKGVVKRKEPGSAFSMFHPMLVLGIKEAARLSPTNRMFLFFTDFSDFSAFSAKERIKTHEITVLWIYNNILLIYYATKIF